MEDEEFPLEGAEDVFGFTMADQRILKALKSKQKGWKTEHRTAQRKLSAWA